MSDSTIYVTEENFSETVLKAPQMVLVLFGSEHSSSVAIQKAELAALTNEYKDSITFAEANVDTQSGLVGQWNIDGLPTLIFFKNGNEIYRIKGIVMRDKLRRQIAGALLAN